MNIYFVRHGESTENAFRIFDEMDSPLTDLGNKQAKYLAQRFKKVKLDIIYSSDMLRAVQTAKEVNQYHNVDHLRTKLIREKKLPSELYKLSESDEKAKKVMSLIRSNIHDENFRYKDQETFLDLKSRVFKFIHKLEKLNLDNVLVVAHGYVLRSVVGYILFGDEYDSHRFVSLKDNFLTVNTGVTLCKYSKTAGWKLLTWNDHAHLAD